MKREGLRTKCCPHRSPFQYTFKHSSGEADASSVSILVYCDDMIVIVVQDAPAYNK